MLCSYITVGETAAPQPEMRMGDSSDVFSLTVKCCDYMLVAQCASLPCVIGLAQLEISRIPVAGDARPYELSLELVPSTTVPGPSLPRRGWKKGVNTV